MYPVGEENWNDWLGGFYRIVTLTYQTPKQLYMFALLFCLLPDPEPCRSVVPPNKRLELTEEASLKLGWRV